MQKDSIRFSLNKTQGGWIPEGSVPGSLTAQSDTGACVFVDDCSQYDECYDDRSKCTRGSYCLTINDDLCEDCCQPGRSEYEYNQMGSGADNWIQGGKCDGSWGPGDPPAGIIESFGMIESLDSSNPSRCVFYVCNQSGGKNRCNKVKRNWGNYAIYLTRGYSTFEECCSACGCETAGACCNCAEDPPCELTTKENCKTTGPDQTVVWKGEGTICSSCPQCVKMGACCTCSDGSEGSEGSGPNCTQTTQEDCTATEGGQTVVWREGEDCESCDCENLKGACCDCAASPTCTQTKQEDCKSTEEGTPAVWKGAGTACSSCEECPGNLGQCTYTYFYGAFLSDTVCTVCTEKQCAEYANKGSFFGNDKYIWKKCSDQSTCNSLTQCGSGTNQCQKVTYLPNSYPTNPCGLSNIPNGWADATTYYQCSRLPESGAWMVTKTELYTCPPGSRIQQFGSSGGSTCNCVDQNGNFTSPIPPPASFMADWDTDPTVIDAEYDVSDRTTINLGYENVFDLSSSSSA